MRDADQAYPVYARSERIADGTMHALGVVGALIGTFLLMLWTVGQHGSGMTIALAIYGLALIATFMASACYHMTPWEELRPTLRRLDHAAIHLKIAGTYTPLVVMVGSITSYLVLAIVWTMAVVGMVRHLFFGQSSGKLGLALYLLMGWLSVALIWSLIPILPVSAICLIAAGGLLYTFGVLFFSWENLKFSNAIWHGFVVAASACFYVAISMAALAMA